MKAKFGAASAALVLAIVVALGYSELRVKTTYWDALGGVWTVCAGVTGEGVVPGRTYSNSECQAMETRYVKRMLSSMGRCVQGEFDFNVIKAFGHFAYNVGTANFCASTAAKLLTRGDIVGACKQILRWTFIKGKDCRDRANKCFGIVTRRTWEYQTCMGQA